jgi:hypothetical protein
MILVFLGPPRTGTYSTYLTLGKHEEVARSIRKEPMNSSKNRHIFPIKYFEEFRPNDKTKVLLDATPCAYSFPHQKPKVDMIKMEKRIIYPFRNPFDRLYSNIKQQTIWYFRFGPQFRPSYINENYAYDESEILKWIDYMLDRKHVDNAMKTGKVLLFKFKDFNIAQILDFLDLTPMPSLRFMRSNTVNSWYLDKHKIHRLALDDIWRRNLKTIADMIYKDLEKMSSLIDVGDYMEDVERRVRR